MDKENHKENLSELDLLINFENIPDIIYKKQIISQLKKSIIPEWNIKNLSNENISNENISNKNIFNNQNQNQIQSNFSTNFSTNFSKKIIGGIKNTNIINQFDSEITFDSDLINMLEKLNNLGIQFDMRFGLDWKIKIESNQVIFPMCCVGKNRSQYMFYYLKKMQVLTKINFQVGYPSSGDEISIVTDHIWNSIDPNINLNLNPNVLSSFFPQYKKDNFSKVIGQSLKIANLDGLDGLEGVSRSIHVFDKILKVKQDYLPNEFANFEINKYKQNKYDIFDVNSNNQDYLKIKILFEKCLLIPDNLNQIINFDLEPEYQVNKITWICMSDKSFVNLIKCFDAIKSKYPNIKLNNVRIVYFGIKDIFQKSNIKLEEIDDFKEKIDSGFEFLDWNKKN
jgi:hypothetical protein